MTNTQVFTGSQVAAEQRELRQISVDMLVDLVGLSVADARLRVAASMLADAELAARIGATTNPVVAERTAVDVALRSEWGV